MTYGIKVTGVDNNYQIDSTDSETEFLAVKSSGNLGNGAGPGSNYVLGDLLMVGHANSSNTANSSKVVEVIFNNSGLAPTLTYGGDYLICRGSNSHTSNANQTEDYGVQVKNASNIVCFDSRNLSKGLEITKIWPRFGRNGGYPGQTGLNPLWINDTANEIYSGADLGKVYVSCAGSQHPTPPATGYHFMSFKYIYDANGTSGKIKLINAYIFYGSAYLGLNNLQQIVVGELIE